MSMASSERDPLLPERTETHGNNPDRASELQGTNEISRSTRWGILAGVWTATFLSAVNTTLVPTMLSSISSEFKRSNQASWIGTAYLLSTCTFNSLYGRLSDVLGRKRANHLALFFFGVGVLGCGLSTSMEMLIISRFISGMGGGGLMTISSIIISDLYSIRQRGLAQGIGTVFNSLGTGLGGPLGGFITDRFGWRWAFLIQLPLFFGSFFMTSYHLRYTTAGKGRNMAEVLARIDWGGSISLLIAVAAGLALLSARYNEGLPWLEPTVITSLCVTILFAIAFLVIELCLAREPLLAPFLLKQKIPLLIGLSNFLVAMCNFTIIYFFPMWFQTVMLTSASTAGLHLVPNSVALSCGSVFAGYMMHKTGRYKTINLTFGFLPVIGASLIASMRRDSLPLLTWISILPLGFGNAVVFQTVLIALLARLTPSQVAVGTGFTVLWRSLGQVGGVAISSAIFQSTLDGELRQRIFGEGAEELISKIRRSSQLVATLPPAQREAARDSYAMSLHRVFALAAWSTFLAFIVRLPIPDKDLDGPRKGEDSDPTYDSVSVSAAFSDNQADSESTVQAGGRRTHATK